MIGEDRSVGLGGRSSEDLLAEQVGVMATRNEIRGERVGVVLGLVADERGEANLVNILSEGVSIGVQARNASDAQDLAP